MLCLQVLRVAVVGTSCMLLAMVLGGLGIGLMWGVSARESAFVAACVSLSSTPLVVKFLNTGGDPQDEGKDFFYNIDGLVQDCCNSIALAVFELTTPPVVPDG